MTTEQHNNVYNGHNKNSIRSKSEIKNLFKKISVISKSVLNNNELIKEQINELKEKIDKIDDKVNKFDENVFQNWFRPLFEKIENQYKTILEIQQTQKDFITKDLCQKTHESLKIYSWSLFKKMIGLNIIIFFVLGFLIQNNVINWEILMKIVKLIF